VQKSRDRAPLRRLAPLLVAGLAGCQLLGQDGEPEPARSAALEGRAETVLTYPNLHTVPPRPQLSYSVEQQREIVEQLISDREHARYTDRLIRYESGLSSLPPPPAPPPPPDSAAVAAQVVQAAPQAPAGPPATAPLSTTAQTSPYRTDDGSLDDVMQDLVTNTGPSAAPPAPSVPLAGSAAPAAAAPSPPAPTQEEPDDAPSASSSEEASSPRDEAQSLGDRLFGWIGDLFGEEASAETEAEPSAAPEGGAAGASGSTVTSGAPGPLAYARPSLKPMHVATPPLPSPAKPEGALASGAADTRTSRAEQGALAVIPFSPGSALLGAGYDVALERAFAGAAGDPVEVRARGGGRALAVDRARAVALALVRAGARPEDLELVISGSGPDEVRVVPVADPS
jgi:hypothetical protein